MALLFLHGYTQSGPLFSAKTKAMTKPLLKSLSPHLPTQPTLHFPTAPHRLLISDIPGSQSATPGSSGTPLDTFPANADNDIESYGWWRKDPTTGHAIGLDKTWSFLKEYIEANGPFVGIVGFSQGAALAGMLAAALEEGGEERAPRELDVMGLRERVGQKGVKFVVAYSGFRVKGEDWAYIGDGGIQTPVLNFVGALDTVVDEGRTRELVEACKGKREAVHPGGHFVPAGKQWVQVVCGFVEKAVKGELDEEKGQSEEEDAADMDVPF